jgi:hypothetical protein
MTRTTQLRTRPGGEHGLVNQRADRRLLDIERGSDWTKAVSRGSRLLVPEHAVEFVDAVQLVI